MDDLKGHRFIIPRVQSNAEPHCLNCYVNESKFKESLEECRSADYNYKPKPQTQPRHRLVKMDISQFNVVIKEDFVPVAPPKIQHRAEVLALIEQYANVTDIFKFFTDKYGYNEETTVHALAENGIVFPKTLNEKRKRDVKVLDRKQQLQELSLIDLDPWETEGQAHIR